MINGAIKTMKSLDQINKSYKAIMSRGCPDRHDLRAAFEAKYDVIWCPNCEKFAASLGKDGADCDECEQSYYEYHDSFMSGFNQ